MLAISSRQALITTTSRRALNLLGRGSPAAARRSFFTIIEQGREGWKLTFGKNPQRLDPGLALYLPGVQTIIKVDLRESSISIPNLPGYTADNVPVSCSGSLFYKISDSYKSCFQVTDVIRSVENTGTSAMRSVIGNFTYDQVIGNRNDLNIRLNQVIGSTIAAWGVECTRFEVQSFKPANREVERQLELQMEAERNRRKQILDTQAQINVAEGEKQRVILESEAHLVAKSNEADAQYKTVIREAEARQQQSRLEAVAIAQQVEDIARSVAIDKDNITPSERRLALTTLVELQRLQQLKAIANGPGNATYFFGDQSALGAGSANSPYTVDYLEGVKRAGEKNVSPAVLTQNAMS